MAWKFNMDEERSKASGRRIATKCIGHYFHYFIFIFADVCKDCTV
jgi:hypothetical protein